MPSNILWFFLRASASMLLLYSKELVCYSYGVIKQHEIVRKLHGDLEQLRLVEKIFKVRRVRIQDWSVKGVEISLLKNRILNLVISLVSYKSNHSCLPFPGKFTEFAYIENCDNLVHLGVACQILINNLTLINVLTLSKIYKVISDFALRKFVTIFLALEDQVKVERSHFLSLKYCPKESCMLEVYQLVAAQKLSSPL